MKQRATPRGLVLFGEVLEADEQRAAPRIETKCIVLVTNLSLQTKTVIGFLHDVCTTGMRIGTGLPVHVGDEIRVHLPSFMVVGEVVHYAVGAQGRDAGLRLARPLNCDELDQCVESSSWGKILSPEFRRPRLAAVVCR